MENGIQIQELLNLVIVGALLSVVIEIIQRKFSVNGGYAKLLTIALALVVGTAYVLLRATSWWVTIVAILSAASTVYAIFIPASKKVTNEEFEG